jgi:hypothetical protein
MISPDYIRNNIFLLFFLPLFVYGNPSLDWAGDMRIRGRVIDQETRASLAFVNILVENTQTGTVSDLDGYFSITLPEPNARLVLSYVGYYNVVFEIDPHQNIQTIMMQRRAIELPVVEVLPGINPAHRIIENAIAARLLNDPKKAASFSYESYNRFLFTARYEQEHLPQDPSADTSEVIQSMRKWIRNHHFMIMETVTQRSFRYPSLETETVLASRTSGLRSQALVLMATQFQSFSFYDDPINIAGNQYVSPLSPGSASRYFFLLEDTTFTQTADSVFIISFRPGLGRNFEGLKGVLYINSNGWALQNVIAEPAVPSESMRVRIQQVYELIDGRRWFPTQINTDLEFVEMEYLPGVPFIGEGRTYLRNIRIDPLLRRRDFSPYSILIAPDTIRNKNAFWDKHRPDTLGMREINTFSYIDSIGQVYNFDRILTQTTSLLRGYLRLGILNVEIGHLLRFNDYQGFRPGLGLRTNHRFSHIFGLNARIAYGFKNESLTYGLGAEILLHRNSEFEVGYDYQKEYHEPGSFEFLERPTLLSPVAIRSFFFRNFDLVESHTAWLSFRAFRNNLTVKGYMANEDHYQRSPYVFVPDVPNPSTEAGRFRFFETGINLRLAFGERFVKTPTRTYARGDNAPVVSLNLARGWGGVLNGQHDYWRTSLKLEHRFRIKMAGVQHWVLHAGYVYGQPPWPKLFTAQASYRPFSIAVPQSFATMRMGEFISDRYLKLFFSHNFENLLFRGKGFSPGLAIKTNIGFGSLNNPEAHQGMNFNSMNRGFFESGIAITNLLGQGLTRMGLEFIYRYGPYEMPRFQENISVRLRYEIMF